MRRRAGLRRSSPRGRPALLWLALLVAVGALYGAGYLHGSAVREDELAAQAEAACGERLRSLDEARRAREIAQAMRRAREALGRAQEAIEAEDFGSARRALSEATRALRGAGLEALASRVAAISATPESAERAVQLVAELRSMLADEVAAG